MSRKSRILVILLISGIIGGTYLPFWPEIQLIKADSKVTLKEISEESIITVQENSLIAKKNASKPDVVIKKIGVIVTAYSSSPEETDNTPLITASGSTVKEGIVANNLLPFGTRIKMPELYKDQVFVVEDRMHQRKGYYHIDVWFPSKEEAQFFGAKQTYIEVLEG